MIERIETIILDTNVLHQAWPYLSVETQNLFEAARKLNVSIAITEPSLIELRRGWREVAKRKTDKAKDAIEQLERLHGNLSLSEKIPLWNTLEGAYDGDVNRLFAEWSIVKIPFPQTSIDLLFRQASDRAMLFGDKGANFQDMVILHAAIEHASKQKTSAVIITGDGVFEDRKKTWRPYAEREGANLNSMSLPKAIEAITHLFTAAEQKRIQERRDMASKAIIDYLPKFQEDFNESLTWSKRLDLVGYYLEDAQFDRVADISVSHVVNVPEVGSVVEFSAVVQGAVVTVKKFLGALHTNREPFEVGMRGIAKYLKDGYEVIRSGSVTYGNPGIYGHTLTRQFENEME